LVIPFSNNIFFRAGQVAKNHLHNIQLHLFFYLFPLLPNLLQPLNEYAPKYTNSFGNLTSFNEVHP